MDDYQESKVSMIDSSTKALDNNQSLWEADSGIASIKSEIEANRARISEEHKAQTRSTHGATEVKNELRNKLNNLLIKILVGLQAAAVKNENLKLENETRYTEWGLKHMRQEQMPDFAEKILSTANANKTDLTI